MGDDVFDGGVGKSGELRYELRECASVSGSIDQGGELLELHVDVGRRFGELIQGEVLQSRGDEWEERRKLIPSRLSMYVQAA